MKTTPKIQSRLAAACFTICVLVVSMGTVALGIVYHTVGDGGADHTAFLYSPIFFYAASREAEYLDHVCTDINGTCGQQYDEDSFCFEFWEPNPDPVFCVLENFLDIIRNSQDIMGTLMISSHGTTDLFYIEIYANTVEGETARHDAYLDYLWAGYSSSEIIEGELSSGHYTIGVTGEFIRRYGRLSKGFVFMNASYGSSLNDDFIAAGARVVTGFPGDIGFPQVKAVSISLLP